VPEAGADPFHQAKSSGGRLSDNRCTAHPQDSCHVRCSVWRLQAAVDDDLGTDRNPKPPFQLRTTDNKQNRSLDPPRATSTLDAYRCRLHDCGARRHSFSGDPMRVSANLDLRRHHRLMRRQHCDGSMTEPLHTYEAGGYGRRGDDGDRRDEG
jgi:hypothetical protein